MLMGAIQSFDRQHLNANKRNDKKEAKQSFGSNPPSMIQYQQQQVSTQPQYFSPMLPQFPMQSVLPASNRLFPSMQAAGVSSSGLIFQAFSPKQQAWENTATQALNLINGLINTKQKLNPLNQQHVAVLENLKNTLGGSDVEVPDPDNPTKTIKASNGLTIQNLNKPPKEGEKSNLEILKTTLSTMLEATHYNPTTMKMGYYDLKVNNKQLLPLLKPNYQPAEFNILFQTLDQNGTFKVTTHPVLGIAKTAGTSAEEDFEMGARYWATDSCHNIKLMKAKAPASVPKALQTLAKFYKQEEPFIDQLITDPQFPKTLLKNKDEERGKLLGLPHIFIPEESNGKITIKPDEKFNRWRQESHGHTLRALVSGVKEGLVENKPYGLKPQDINDDVIGSIGNLTAYFKAVDYPNMPSSGNWEEQPFQKGLTSDTSVIVDALKGVNDLMFNPQYNNNRQVNLVRQKLLQSKQGNLLGNQQEMNKLIKIGEDRIKQTYTEEAPNAPGISSRKIDASQAFAVKLTKFDDDPVKDAQKKVEVLKGIEDNLRGDYGIARYNESKVVLPNNSVQTSGDSYIGPNYEIAVDKSGGINLGFYDIKEKFGARDCSTAELFLAREKVCGGEKEKTAQWFFDPVMSSAYNKIRKDLSQYVAQNPTEQQRVKPLINFCFTKQTEYINRSIARVIEKGTIKANGVKYPFQEWGVPEAYMNVTSLKPTDSMNLADTRKQSQFLPGLNTPLTWAQSELWTACNDYVQALQQEKNSFISNNNTILYSPN